MPFILIKNHFKLMLRNKWILLLMIFLPIVTIALLSNAFKDMLDASHTIEIFKAGYRISENSSYGELLPELKKISEKNGCILEEYPKEDIAELMRNNVIAVFVDMDDNSFTIYQSENKKIEAAITESIFSSFFYQVSKNTAIMTYSMEHGIAASSSSGSIQAVTEKLDTDPVPSSTDYYGIIYIVYGTWCGMITLVAVISSERKGAVLRRMRVSGINRFQNFLGKFIPGTLAIFIEVCIAWLLTTLLFDIHWGNIGISVLIIFLTSMAAATFGIVIFQLVRNVAVSIVLGFTLIWIAGFFGGSFQTYMYSILPKGLVAASPLYYINRTLVEFSTKGSSDYTGLCIVWLIVIIAAGMVLGTLLMGRKLESQD